MKTTETKKQETLRDQFFAPLEIALGRAKHTRACNNYSDQSFVHSRVGRVIEASKSGRAWIQFFCTVEAFNIMRDHSWYDNAVMCFNWFLGHNDLNLPLYDAKTGGCRDGLMADGINQNEGAESSLAWLLSLMTLQKLNADEVLKQPILQKLEC